MAERVGPIRHSTSEKSQKEIPDKDRFKKELTVEKVGEIDADQKKRKRERAAPSDDDKVKKTGREEVQKAYSPYEPQFHSTALQSDLFGRNTKVLKETPVSDFGSPIPSMIPSPSGTIDDEESSRLPSSQDFYKNYTSERPVETRRDRPIERRREAQQDRTEERESPEPTGKKEKGKKEKEFLGKAEKEMFEEMPSKPGKEEFPFLVKKGKEGKPQKVEAETFEEEAIPPPSREKREKVSFKEKREEIKEAPYVPPLKEGKKVEKHIPAKKEKEIEEPPFYREKEPREERAQPLPKRAFPKEQPLGAPATPEFFSPIFIVTTTTKIKPEKKMAPSLTEAVTSTPPPQFMPPTVAQSVSLAANQLMPYANPELQNLFAQMVGTITVMTTPPGITETRVVLNSPAFEKSLFNGAEIVFQRYATAPDSFNITLTGSNAAVNLFNANLPALYSAFQKGHFKFRIGKLETSYESSRPVFRRKEGGEGGGAGERGRR
ncbi:MAG TPA: hypothetical protein VLG44_07140 [Chlamydiales bacterium]|nr:hypothetical protein [Chlamydiales bacterium]